MLVRAQAASNCRLGLSMDGHHRLIIHSRKKESSDFFVNFLSDETYYKAVKK
jgi:hypothetical protein